MADDGYEYMMSMPDRMSGPARDITSALGGLQRALGGTEGRMGQLTRAHERAAKAAQEHAGRLDDVARGFAKSLFGIGGGLSRAIAEGQLFAHAIEQVGDLAREGIKFAVEASELKDNAVAAYQTIYGTAEEGERTFRALDRTAREIHMPSEKAQAIAQQLMLEGLRGQEAITQTIEAIGDLQRVGLAGGADKLQSVIARSIAAGHLEMRGPRALAGTGATFEKVAAELGLGRQQFEQELKSGKISAEQGIEAIDRAILKGKVGELATKRFTITDAFVDLKNSIRGVFQETDSGPLVEALKKVSEQFAEGSKGADALKTAIDDTIEGIAKIVETAGDIGEAMMSAADKARDAWDDAMSFITRHDPLLSEEAKSKILRDKEIDKMKRGLSRDVAKQQEGLEAVQQASAAGKSPAELRKIGEKYGLKIEAGKQAYESYVQSESEKRNAQVRALQQAGIADPDTFHAGGRAASITREVPQGTDAESKMHDIGADMAEGMRKGAAEESKSHSPSEVMYDVGANMAQGFEAGASSGRGMFGAPTGAGSSSSSSSSSKSIHVPVDVGGIHLHGTIDAEEVTSLLEWQIADIFERVALELGQ